MTTLEQLWHCTWRGRAEWVWYRIRERFVVPAPAHRRCIMGYPIGPDMRCPRGVVDDGLWCRRHAKEARP